LRAVRSADARRVRPHARSREPAEAAQLTAANAFMPARMDDPARSPAGAPILRRGELEVAPPNGKVLHTFPGGAGNLCCAPPNGKALHTFPGGAGNLCCRASERKNASHFSWRRRESLLSRL